MKKLRMKVKSKEEKPALLDVPMDEVGKFANDYVDVLGEIKNREETLESLGSELVIALQKSNKQEIFVRGITLKIKHIKAKIKIAVKNSRE